MHCDLTCQHHGVCLLPFIKADNREPEERRTVKVYLSAGVFQSVLQFVECLEKSSVNRVLREGTSYVFISADNLYVGISKAPY